LTNAIIVTSGHAANKQKNNMPLCRFHTETIQQNHLNAKPQTNQIASPPNTHKQVELCTNLTNVIGVTSHAPNIKKSKHHHITFTLKPYSKTTSMQNHKQIKPPLHQTLNPNFFTFCLNPNFTAFFSNPRHNHFQCNPL